MLVSVCMIVRNEEAIIGQAVASVAGLADEIVALDTGSTDGTVELLENLGVRVLPETGDRMHKGQCRNRVIDAANGDWVVILDADEQVADPAGLRQHIETTDAQALYIKLAYVDNNSNPALSYQQMRCWRRDAYRYQYRAHEVPVPVDGWGKIEHTSFVWEHRPPPDRTWKSDYTLNRLLLDVEENPGVARPLYYLGRQYTYRGEWQLALDRLTEYLDIAGSDKADAWYCVASCHNGLGQEGKRISALYQACAAAPHRREWWGELAAYYHSKDRDSVAVGLLKCALEQPMPARSYIRHQWHGAHIHDLLARCLWKLERYEEGYKHALRATVLEPGDKRLSDNLAWFERKLGLVQATKVFITGCAKSGTTLLKRLFYAFDDVEVVPDEEHITRFCQRKSQARFLVGKRHRYSLFSEHLTPAQTDQFVGLVKEHGVKIINIVRDGRDVIFSDHMNVSPRRWIAAMRHRQQYADLVSVEARYEDVVSDPDGTQERLAQALGLTIKHRWSDYPSFVPEHEFAGGIYGKRPLDAASVGKGLDYRALIDDIAYGFEQELEAAGYEPS